MYFVINRGVNVNSILVTKRDNILNRCTKKYNEKKIILFIRSLGQLKR